MKRRKFISKSLIHSAAVGIGVPSVLASCKTPALSSPASTTHPLVLSTWNNIIANDTAYEVLTKEGKAIDAVEKGVRIPEADPGDQSVGYGGRPDRDGNVTLDACIMDSRGNCGAVTYVQGYKHPVSIARKVMEETPHVILSGNGAEQFAAAQGFMRENLLTEKSKQEWEAWKKESKYAPVINIERHDTIGMLVMDNQGDIAGACSTSGLAYKMAGRVGDSPIIGSGLFVDNAIGAATATGMGEAVLRSVGSFLVVELMRQGASPAEACKEAVMRIAEKQDVSAIQVGYIALDKKGNYGGYALKGGFVYRVTNPSENTVYKADAHME